MDNVAERVNTKHEVAFSSGRNGDSRLARTLLGRAALASVAVLSFALSASPAVASVGATAGTALPLPAGDQLLVGKAVHVSGNRAIVSAPVRDNGGLVSAYVFGRADAASPWVFDEALSPVPGVDDTVDFGTDVAIDGEWAAVGAFEFAGGIGAIFVFHEVDGSWQYEHTIEPPVLQGGLRFGHALALSGSTLLAPSVSGYVASYELQAGSLAAPVFLAPPAEFELGAFGVAVAIDGQTAVVGAPAAREGQGAAYVYERIGNDWGSGQELSEPGSFSLGMFVDLSNGLALVGSAAAGHVFDGAQAWAPAGTLQLESPDVVEIGEGALSGDVAALTGANSQGDLSVFVFQNEGGWRLQTEVTPTVPSPTFGTSVSLSGRTLLIGDQGANDSAGEGLSFDLVDIAGVAATPFTGPVGGLGLAALLAALGWVGVGRRRRA